MKKNLSKLERVPLREAWKHEATEFAIGLAVMKSLCSLSESLAISAVVWVATKHWNAAINWTVGSRLLKNTSK